MKAIRVLFLTQHYPPEVAATGQLLEELAEDLVADGFQVTVLAGRPAYGLREGGGSVPYRERRQGVDVIRTYSTRFHRRSRPGRALNWLSYPLAGLGRGLARLPRPDVVVAYSTPPTVLPVGYLLARRWRARLVLYLQDLYPQVACAVGALRDGVLVRAWGSLNRALYRRADLVLTLGEFMAARVASLGVPSQRIASMHNWADGTRLYPIPRAENPLRQALGLSDRFVVLYSGNLGAAHDFGPVCEAMGILRPYRDRLAFLFVGDGVRRPEVEDFVQREGLGDFVHLRDYVPQEELLPNLNLADASLLTVRDGTEGLVVPSKVYAYLAVGRPVLAVCPQPCEVTEIVSGAQCGFVARTGAELASAVLRLLEEPGLQQEMGRRGRQLLLERFDRHKATARIGEILRSASEGPAHA